VSRRKIDIMPGLLIAGCGYLGEAVAELFRAGDWEVEGWTISRESAQALSKKLNSAHAVDLSDRDQVCARAEEFDLVLHCASTRGGGAGSYRRVYLNGVRNLLERFTRAKILFVSSTSVYAQSNGEWVTEESVADPSMETGKILREAEEVVLGKSGIVLRLAGIYGPGRSALLTKFLSGEAIIDSGNDRFLNAIHRDDAAAAIKLVAAPSVAAGIYNVVDNEPVLQSECYRWLAAKLNRPIPPIGRSTSSRKRGATNKRVSNAKLRALGWRPQYATFGQGMAKSVLLGFNLDHA
jgi:nucleoside-diphosphate-sugar epimerase